MRSSISNYNCSFKKLVVMSKLIKSYKDLKVIMMQLSFLPQKAAKILKTLIHSAISNSKQPVNNLEIQEIRLGRGKCNSRFMPRARGRTFYIKKQGINIEILLKNKEEIK